MKTLILIVSTVLLCGCDSDNTEVKATLSGNTVREVKVDGCSYLVFLNGGITHKANCTNHVSK